MVHKVLNVLFYLELRNFPAPRGYVHPIRQNPNHKFSRNNIDQQHSKQEIKILMNTSPTTKTEKDTTQRKHKIK